jgi:hypothetical protein
MDACVPQVVAEAQLFAQQVHQLIAAIPYADSAQHYSATVAVLFVTCAQDNIVV